FTNTGTIADISRVVRPILTLGTDQAAIAVTGDAMVTNAGFVEVMGGGQSTGAEVSAGTFINTGTIYEEVIPLLTYGTTRYAGYQFDSGVTAFGSGMVVNDGVIGNCTLHQGGVYLSGAAGLTNSGTIFAYGGFGLSATTSGTIVNSGTIYGSRAGAYLSSGAVLVNTGTISGSLEFKRKWFFRFQ
ncbi:MAG TPA: hypothetical protein VKS60_16730, partial [Stellaceae bacterium]|nr:hypothetical protein [Stellaceae bacterium]